MAEKTGKVLPEGVRHLNDEEKDEFLWEPAWRTTMVMGPILVASLGVTGFFITGTWMGGLVGVFIAVLICIAGFFQGFLEKSILVKCVDCDNVRRLEQVESRKKKEYCSTCCHH